MLPGAVYFGGESSVWGGGMAFYAPEPPTGWPRTAAARGYLLTAGQFADLVAQEMHRAADGDLDLTPVLRHGRDMLGSGRYETLVRAGDLDGHPILTCTAPGDPAAAELRAPSARYVGMIAAGLYRTFDWSVGHIHEYLAALPGIDAVWDRGELTAVIEDMHQSGCR
ncbi:histone deacetylase [Nocardia acidivorans]|uniref:histone deacetylase n=1 Tax=Nocardia acidivorans TaxID=404580 RepID=UPI0012FB7469|nr:histone deacetylase [Nocardia acidivorans]